MDRAIRVTFRGNSTETLDFDIPNDCPHCGHTMLPEIKNAYSDAQIHQRYSKIGLFAQCTVETCKKYFPLEYEIQYAKPANSSYSKYGEPKLQPYSYRPPVKIDLPENIEKISPQFVEIYAEATLAEQAKLKQISGVGYRKSAEFLIKDYAINKNPTEEDSIKSKMLMQVITKYLDDFPKIQNLAKAIAWIGNDETHYERRHDDKDIKDLKKFIKAAAQFIAADYDADEALEFTTKD